MLKAVVQSGLRNPVFLTGDWHSTFANELKLDFKDPGSPTVATEFVTPAITSGGDGTPYGPYYAPMIPFNPHIKYYEGDKRGYFKATVTPRQMKLDLRFMTSVENPNGVGYTERSFVVEDGRPGILL
jgi:alkaline phosphatase D